MTQKWHRGVTEVTQKSRLPLSSMHDWAQRISALWSRTTRNPDVVNTGPSACSFAHSIARRSAHSFACSLTHFRAHGWVMSQCHAVLNHIEAGRNKSVASLLSGLERNNSENNGSLDQRFHWNTSRGRTVSGVWLKCTLFTCATWIAGRSGAASSHFHSHGMGCDQ